MARGVRLVVYSTKRFTRASIFDLESRAHYHPELVDDQKRLGLSMPSFNCHNDDDSGPCLVVS